MNKTILITGASTGIGHATAIYFAKRGFNVVATMRNVSKAGELNKFQNISVLPLDVTNIDSIKAAIEQAISIYGSIDILFNNAGYGLVGAFEAMSSKQLHGQFETNVFGVMNMIQAILPYFRQQKHGLIINTTSIGGIVAFPLYSVYHSTKWAIEGFAESLQYELEQFNIRIKNIEPGVIKTDFDKSLQFINHEGYNGYVEQMHNRMLNSYKNGGDVPEVVAAEVYRAALDNSSRLRYPAGNQAKLLFILKKFLPNRLYFWIIKKALSYN